VTVVGVFVPFRAPLHWRTFVHGPDGTFSANLDQITITETGTYRSGYSNGCTASTSNDVALIQAPTFTKVFLTGCVSLWAKPPALTLLLAPLRLAATGLSFTDNFPAGMVIASTQSSHNCTGGTLQLLGRVWFSYTGGTANASCTVRSVDVISTESGRTC
jgi:hypothetical protein